MTNNQLLFLVAAAFKCRFYGWSFPECFSEARRLWSLVGAQDES